jgi:hypothetical protein
MDPTNRPFLAVLDGADPQAWTPWGSSCMGDLSLQFEEGKLKVPPVDRDLAAYHFHLVLQAEHVIFGWKDNEWSRIVGAVVDCSKPAKPTKETFLALCRAVRDAKDSWSRRYGFFLTFVLPPDWIEDEHGAFYDGLRKDALDLLQIEIVVRLVDAEHYFVPSLQDLNRSLIESVKKYLATGGGKR